MFEPSSDEQEADESGQQWKHLLAVATVVGLCAAGVALAYHLSSEPFLKGGFSLSPSYNNSVNRPTSSSNNLFYMEPVVINSGDIDSTDFVRVTLTLELDQPGVADQLKARQAAVENAVVIATAGRGAASLRSVEGKTQLRRDITKAINGLLPDGGVRAVYFADFLVR